jgi:hypothetical protein
MSRDHIFWLKIACIYFDLHGFDFYFSSLTRKQPISNHFKISLDLLWFCQDKNLRWQWSLFYLPLAKRWNQLVHWFGGLKMVQPHLFTPKKRSFHKNEKLIRPKTLFETIKYRTELRLLGWKLREYLAAEIIPMYPRYTLLQTCWALWVSPRTKYRQRRLNTLREMTWPDNPEVYLLSGYRSEYPFLFKDMGNYYFDQSTSTVPEEIEFDETIAFLESI